MTTEKPTLNFAGPESPISKLAWAIHHQLMQNIIDQGQKVPDEAVYSYQVATLTALVQTFAMLSTIHYGVENMPEIRPMLHQQLDNYMDWSQEDCLAQVREKAN